MAGLEPAYLREFGLSNPAGPRHFPVIRATPIIRVANSRARRRRRRTIALGTLRWPQVPCVRLMAELANRLEPALAQILNSVASRNFSLADLALPSSLQVPSRKRFEDLYPPKERSIRPAYAVAS